jgi:hypothetical protein
LLVVCECLGFTCTMTCDYLKREYSVGCLGCLLLESRLFQGSFFSLYVVVCVHLLVNSVCDPFTILCIFMSQFVIVMFH